MFKSHIEIECWRYRDETQEECEHWTRLHRHASLIQQLHSLSIIQTRIAVSLPRPDYFLLRQLTVAQWLKLPNVEMRLQVAVSETCYSDQYLLVFLSFDKTLSCTVSLQWKTAHPLHRPFCHAAAKLERTCSATYRQWQTAIRPVLSDSLYQHFSAESPLMLLYRA